MEQEKPQRRIVGDPATVPNIYTNSSFVSVGPYDVLVRYFLEGKDVTEEVVERRLVAELHLSHSHAWTFAHLVLRLIRQMVEEQGIFLVYDTVLEGLNLTEEYKQLKEWADAADGS